MQLFDKNSRKARRGGEALNSGEARLAMFTVEASADAIFWILPDGAFYHVNPAACEELGYTREELEKLHVWDIDPLFPREMWPRIWKETKEKGALKFETLHRTKAGKTITVEINASYLRCGDAEYACAFSRDITERKRAEEALLESEAKFRAVFEGTFQFLGLLSAEGKLLDVNRAALASIGASKSDVLGKPFWKTPWCNYTPELEEKIRDSIVRARQGGFVRFETTFRAADGNLRYIDYSIKPMVDERGRITLLIPEGRDITDRKLAEDALLESEAKFRVLSETPTVAIFVFQGKRFVTVNQATTALTGYSKKELLEMNFLSFVHPDFRQLVYERSQARQRGEPLPPRYEFKIIAKGGEVKWVEINAGRIVYKGRPAGVAALFDITERKRALEALSGAKAQAELYLDLMSHDINNLNQSSIGYLELALQRLEAEKQLGIDSKNLIERPLKALAGSTALIANVRKLQRLMTEGIKTVPVDLRELLDSLDVGSLVPGNRKVVIHVEPVPHYKVQASELLKDVFLNLLTNAIKHSCASEPLSIDVAVEPFREDDRAFYRCTVEDNGPGIPDELKAKLFHRFQRGSTQAHGKGLGLYLVRTLVEGYGGRVWVEDRVPGDHRRGARFVVTLPAADQ